MRDLDPYLSSGEFVDSVDPDVRAFAETTVAGTADAVARVVGIPARVGYADVRNHLSTPKLRELVGGDLFVWHGYAELHLEGRWVKATPAFNLTLCERFGRSEEHT